jgi:hypothetical protein
MQLVVNSRLNSFLIYSHIDKDGVQNSNAVTN